MWHFLHAPSRTLVSTLAYVTLIELNEQTSGIVRMNSVHWDRKLLIIFFVLLITGQTARSGLRRYKSLLEMCNTNVSKVVNCYGA